MAEYNPGIEALSGYYYQIKTFVSFLANISDGQNGGYEYCDDIAICDDKESSCNINLNRRKKLFQVKKTNVDENTARKVLYNWLLAEDADEYNLIVAPKYICKDDVITKTDINELYKSLCKTDGMSLQTKVYNKYKENNKKDIFSEKVEHIRSHYLLIPDYNCDEKIFENFKTHFHYTSDDFLYQKRIAKFVEKINTLVLESVHNKEPYVISFTELNAIIENVCMDISEDNYEIDYDLFCDYHPISLSDKKIQNSREYIQLEYCNLSKSMILNRLKDKLYYLDFQAYWLERNKTTKINSIENSAVSNYEDTLVELGNDDSPVNRYSTTIKKEISNTNNKMQSNGVYISLTQETDKRISWKDE